MLRPSLGLNFARWHERAPVSFPLCFPSCHLSSYPCLSHLYWNMQGAGAQVVHQPPAYSLEANVPEDSRHHHDLMIFWYVVCACPSDLSQLAASSKEGALASNLAMLSLNVKETLSSAADALASIGSFFASASPSQPPEEVSKLSQKKEL